MKNQQRVQEFLKDFSSQLSQKFGPSLDFILLFGSAARGEWERGISDVDLIIQLKDQDSLEEIKDFATDLFWKLDQKYDTKFKEVCSTGSDKGSQKILEKAKLYVPFEVFGPQDIDWEKGKIQKEGLEMGAKLVAPQAMLFKKMKHEGEILYGRDIRKEIEVEVSWWEKIKALLVPYNIALCSAILAPFLPKTALRLSDKSVIYSIESTLFFLDKPIGEGLKKSAKRAAREVEKEIKYSPRWEVLKSLELDFILSFEYQKLIDFDFAWKAIEVKYDVLSEEKTLSWGETLKFCWKSLIFVSGMNWYAILRADQNKLILKGLVVLRVVLLFLVVWGFLCLLQKILI